MDGSDQFRRGGGGASAENLVPFERSKEPNVAMPIVSFHRTELQLILHVYSKRVGTGEWRDYAIDMLKDRAVFSIFHRTSETPLFTIEKNPKLARKQGAYSVVNATGQILKRGRDLKQVLKVFDGKPKLRSI